ncbi:MAG: fibronectin type III domain-containing protein, partial [Spirochaetia bacterium]|nr:fibronectin type III domain-containing protein [Spirochaetia bacterium]
NLSNQKIFHIITDPQIPDTIYTLRVFNIMGENGTEAGKKGVTINFTGYDPSAVQRHFRIIIQPVVNTGEDFDVVIDAVDSITGNLLQNFSDDLIFTVTGAGNLSVISEPGFIQGTQTVTLNYSNNALTDGQTESIALIITAALDANMNGTSDPFNATKPASMAGFEFIQNEAALTGQPFSVTINAVGTDGAVFTEYTGTVNLTSSGGTGELSPLTATLTNGMVTLDMTYTALTPNLILNAVDQNDSSLTGISEPFSVATGAGGNASINLTATAISTTEVRLGWQKMETSTEYVIYRKTGANSYTEIHRISPSFTYWVDSGLSTSTTYHYKVEAYNVASQLLGTAFAEAATNNCNIVTPGDVAATISLDTVWTKANGPYCVTANLTIDAWLFIEPGVKVLFSSGTQLIVDDPATTGAGQIGQLNAEGTPQEMVLFTSTSSTPAKGDWNGIHYKPSSAPSNIDMSNNHLGGSYLSFVVIEYAVKALFVETSLVIDYSLIKDNAWLGTGSSGAGLNYLLPNGGKGVIRYTTFINNEVADTGGAAAAFWVSAGTADIVIDKVFSINNKTSTATSGTYSLGGAFNIGKETGTTFNVSITDSYFYNLSAKTGGAIFLQRGISNAIIAGNTFENIYTSNNDGAVHFRCDVTCQSNDIYDNTFINIEGGVFYVNHAAANANFMGNNIHHNNVDGVTDVEGGFFHVNLHGSGSHHQFSNNTFSYNYIKNINTSSTGGAIYIHANSCTGGIYAVNNFQFVNNIVENVNSSDNGGLMYQLIGSCWVDAGFTGIFMNNSLIEVNATNFEGSMFYYYTAGTENISDISVTKNHIFSTDTTGTQNALIWDVNTATYAGRSISMNYNHNNYIINNNIFARLYNVNGNTSVTSTWLDNYWGTDWSEAPWNNVTPSTCTEADPLCIGTTGAVAPVTTPWPHCIDEPANPDCVGARDLCVNTPSDSDCVGVRP